MLGTWSSWAPTVLVAPSIWLRAPNICRPASNIGAASGAQNCSNCCNVLCDDGMSYSDYVTKLNHVLQADRLEIAAGAGFHDGYWQAMKIINRNLSGLPY